MSDLVLKHITKYFGDHKVIDDLSLEIKKGEFITLLGPSGCGKTTLLRMIAGLETLEQGDLYIAGARRNDTPAQKRRIAMVFQSYALFPHMSVRDNILFGLKIRRVAPHDMFEKLTWVLPMLGLEGLEKRLPKEISGGQRQRVALARALVLDPEVLLLDEPLSNLDAALRDMAMEELKRVHRQVGKTIIYVTHNQAEAMTMSERIAILNAGRLEQYNAPKEVYDRPRTIFSAEFIGSPAINMLDGEIGEKNGDIGVRTPVGFILIDKERVEQTARMIGRPVKAGIRPQAIHYSAHRASRRYSDTDIAITIELVENMGDRSLVIGRAAHGAIIRFLVTRDEQLDLDKPVSVFIDGRKIHLFDPENSFNLFEADALAAK
jgi:multiple sugar transport system ATP-binding protein